MMEPMEQNPVIELCIEGMRAESEGRNDDARLLFVRAWDAATDDVEACMAAHYVARHQDSDDDRLHWNAEALRRADAVGDGRVADFYPSLLLNLGQSQEALGQTDAARDSYRRALAAMAQSGVAFPGEHVRASLHAALERLGKGNG